MGPLLRDRGLECKDGFWKATFFEEAHALLQTAMRDRVEQLRWASAWCSEVLYLEGRGVLQEGIVLREVVV